MSQVTISGWEQVVIERLDRFPCAFVFVTDVTPISELFYEQDSADRTVVACGIRVVDQGSNDVTLEKKLYRMTDAVYRMVRHDMFLSATGYTIRGVTKAYSAIEPYQSILFKAGQVSFEVVASDVT